MFLREYFETVKHTYDKMTTYLAYCILGVFGNINNWLLIQKYGTLKPTWLILRNSKIFKPYYLIIRQLSENADPRAISNRKTTHWFVGTLFFLFYFHRNIFSLDSRVQSYNFNKLILWSYNTHLYKYRQYYGHISQFINRIFAIVNNSLTILLSL